MVGGPGRVRAELPVEMFSREAQLARESERAIGEPEVEVEAERRPLHRLENFYIYRERVGDDFVKEPLAELNLALP